MELTTLSSACTTCPLQSCPVRGSRPELVVSSVSKKRWLQALLDAEMLVIAREPGTGLGGPLHELDAALNGVLTASIKQHGFTAALGQRVLIPIDQAGVNLKFVLLVGLEQEDGVQRYNLCGFYRVALDQAHKAGVRKVTLPVFPHRLAAAPITTLGLTTILGCRVHNAPSASGLGIEQVEVLCSPQARRYVEHGTQNWRQLCYRCSDPNLEDSSR